jgi:4'-phosphopantetheinyl transferase
VQHQRLRKHPSMRPEDVHVRLVDLAGGAEAVASAESSLTAAELARARRGTPAVHRRRVLLRAALRAALGADLGIQPRHVPLATTAAGRPYLAGWPDVDANCSASAGLGLVAIAHGRRVGVDVERVVPWSSSVLDEGWLVADEQEAVVSLPLAERAEACTLAWTRKEAVLKARGTGLLDPPSAVVTPVGRPTGLLDGWAVHDLPVPRGWLASLAVGPLEEISA